jgi:ribosomal protein L35
VTGTGKLIRASQKSGKLMNQSSKEKRHFRKDQPVPNAMKKQVNRLLGRG